jgi:RNA polymerase sigma-70 factor (ECF subfamily)
MSVTDDAGLVARVQAGDLKAFEVLYHRYKGPIYRTALAITRQHEAAEEILQECFLRAYKNIGRVDDRAPFPAWLHRIAVNLSYNWLARRRFTLMPLDEMVTQLVSGPAASPERAMERGELRQIIQEAIDSLEFKHRVVIILFYLQGFSLADIAYILDCPVGTVKSRLHYAREKLRRKLEADQRLPAGPVYEFG